MPDTTSSSGLEPPAPASAKKGRGRAFIAGILCVALAGGGYVLGGRGTGNNAAVAIEPPRERIPTIGEIVDLSPVNVNLADGHYLRIAVSLGLVAEERDGSSDGHGEAEEADGHEFPTAPAADLVLSTFSGRSIEQLSSQEGRETARQDLLDGIHAYYGDDEVLTVYFTEFVMQ